ncbi:PREDICTED: uncharacterized protein LOC106110480 [Papilio polytes]|uniref:uncharacterized protein LOC106110480 n=1 Tax=Papilio polytes TaxID=76194 RepID=UPI000676A4C8|nr:PREDICTED: uncharacterized protein LOC106110480 [Papilio polytes]
MEGCMAEDDRLCDRNMNNLNYQSVFNRSDLVTDDEETSITNEFMTTLSNQNSSTVTGVEVTSEGIEWQNVNTELYTVSGFITVKTTEVSTSPDIETNSDNDVESNVTEISRTIKNENITTGVETKRVNTLVSTEPYSVTITKREAESLDVDTTLTVRKSLDMSTVNTKRYTMPSTEAYTGTKTFLILLL